MSKKYSIFFNERTALEENKRQFLSKKIWSNLKEKSSAIEKEQDKILKELSPEEYEEYHNVKDAIFGLFKKGIEGKNITAEGRAMAENSLNNNYLTIIS